VSSTRKERSDLGGQLSLTTTMSGRPLLLLKSLKLQLESRSPDLCSRVVLIALVQQSAFVLSMASELSSLALVVNNLRHLKTSTKTV
jgi:hypothetical protein